MNNKFVFALVMGIFLLSIASAFTDSSGLDNSKHIMNYDSHGYAKKIEIWDNNLFGSPTTKLTTIELLTPHENHIGIGYQKVAEFTIKSNVNYEDIIPSLDLTDIKTGDKIDRQVDIKVKKYKDIEIPVYEDQCEQGDNSTGNLTCEQIQTGIKTIKKEYWEDLDSVNVLKGETITIGLFTTTHEGEHVEWIPKIAKKQITEWASWDSGLDNGNVAYYKLDEQDTTGSGTIIDSVKNYNGTNNGASNSSGKLKTAYDFDGSNDYIDVDNVITNYGTATFNVWINTSSTSRGGILGNDKSGKNDDIMIELDDGTNCPTGKITFYRQDGTTDTNRKVCSDIVVNDNNWHMITGILNSTGMFLYIDGNIQTDTNSFSESSTNQDGFGIGTNGINLNNRMFDGIIDEVGIWNRSLSSSEIDKLNNDKKGLSFRSGIGINSPKDKYVTSNKSQNFNCSAYNPKENITNMSLWTNESGTWEQQNITTGINSQSSTQIWNRTYNYNTFIKWSCQACYGDNSCKFANNRTINILPFVEINRTHNSSSYITAQETYKIYLSGEIPDSIKLLFNGTEYPTIRSGNEYSTTFDIPISNIGNNSIRWKYTYGGNTYYSSYSYQNVENLIFTPCNSTYTTKFLNITFKDESDSTVINASIPTSTFTYYLGSGSTNKTLTYINNSNNYEYDFCATPTDRILKTDYEVAYKSTGYPQRVSSDTNVELSNSTTNKTFYLLSSDDGIYVTFQVINLAQQSIEGVAVNGTIIKDGEDTVIAQGTTNNAGSVTFWLNPNTEHTFMFSKSGYDSYTTTMYPTQNEYTVTLGGNTITNNDYGKGITYSINPTDTTLYTNNEYVFNYTLASSYWTVDEYGFSLSNSTDTLYSTSALTNGGTLSTTYNVSTNDYVYMKYWYKINNTYTNMSRQYYIISEDGTGFGIKTFFSHLSLYLGEGMFGLDNFGLAILSFLFIFVFTGIMSYQYGINSPAAISALVFSLVLFLDVGLGLLDALRPANTNFPVPTVFMGLIMIMLILREAYR